MTTFHHPAALVAGETIELGEAYAHHARVKRLEVADAVRVTTGTGQLADAHIAVLRRNLLQIEVEHTWSVPPSPAIHLYAPVGDRERMLWLAEKGAELGVTSWQSVHFRRSSSVAPRGEGAAFASRLRARMLAAVEQSGSAWLPELRPEVRVEEVDADDRQLRIVLDSHGSPLLGFVPLGARRDIALLLGPEGGIEPDEAKLIASRGWRSARLGSTTLRFETAAVAAIAALRAAELGEV